MDILLYLQIPPSPLDILLWFLGGCEWILPLGVGPQHSREVFSGPLWLAVLVPQPVRRRWLGQHKPHPARSN